MAILVKTKCNEREITTSRSAPLSVGQALFLEADRACFMSVTLFVFMAQASVLAVLRGCACNSSGHIKSAETIKLPVNDVHFKWAYYLLTNTY